MLTYQDAKFAADIKDGRMTIRERKKFDEFIATRQDDIYWLTIVRYKKPRSDKQNRYFHGVIIPMAAQCLFESGDIPHADLAMTKQLLKEKFLAEYEFTVEGKAYIKCRKTSSLKTDEFEKLNTEIRTWFQTERDYYIPEPNEIDWEKY